MEDWRKPALLQPMIVSESNRADYKSQILTPDGLDMLVTSRNHDFKAARMAYAREEDWFFALLTLQTTEGYLGAGNFGISRMNSGSGSRMTLGLRPQGGFSAEWQRDVARLVGNGQTHSSAPNGLTLLWLSPWDGKKQLSFNELDPLYIEICRRVRLHRREDQKLVALTATSKVARVAASALKGVTGDPWTPLKPDSSSSITPSAIGFGYREMTRLLQPGKAKRPFLAQDAHNDPESGMTIVAAALVRGQGKTEGLHRRVIPYSRSIRKGLRGDVFLDRVGAVAQARTDDAATVGERLRTALLFLFQGGPEQDKLRRNDQSSSKKAAPWRESFNLEVDRSFFDEAFWADVAHEAMSPRLHWRKQLCIMARGVFDKAFEAAPRTAERRIRAQAVALNVLESSLNKFVKETADGV